MPTTAACTADRQAGCPPRSTLGHRLPPRPRIRGRRTTEVPSYGPFCPSFRLPPFLFSYYLPPPFSPGRTHLELMRGRPHPWLYGRPHTGRPYPPPHPLFLFFSLFPPFTSTRPAPEPKIGLGIGGVTGGVEIKIHLCVLRLAAEIRSGGCERGGVYG